MIESKRAFVGGYNDIIHLGDGYLDPPESKCLDDATAHFERIVKCLGVADSQYLIRRGIARVVDRERWPRTADLACCNQSLSVDGDGFRTCRTQLVDDL